MSKELDALEIIKSFINERDFYVKYDNGDEKEYHYKHFNEMFPNEFEIIEVALKRLEEQEEILADYGLSLADFRRACFSFAQFKGSGYDFDKLVENAKLKEAIEIIKEKQVDISSLNCAESVEQYNVKENGFIPLTKEEFNLLKEVLL